MSVPRWNCLDFLMLNLPLSHPDRKRPERAAVTKDTLVNSQSMQWGHQPLSPFNSCHCCPLSPESWWPPALMDTNSNSPVIGHEHCQDSWVQLRVAQDLLSTAGQDLSHPLSPAHRYCFWYGNSFKALLILTVCACSQISCLCPYL